MRLESGVAAAVFGSISIHTPAKGATVMMVEISRSERISIHTPAKGATQISPVYNPGFLYFNPHTREGCDDSLQLITPIRPVFQSTHPRRVRQWSGSRTPMQLAISIHTPAKGATCYHVALRNFRGISIHTPAKGATLESNLVQPSTKISIHTPAKGATFQYGKSYVLAVISIHTPAKGATLPSLLNLENE